VAPKCTRIVKKEKDSTRPDRSVLSPSLTGPGPPSSVTRALRSLSSTKTFRAQDGRDVARFSAVNRRSQRLCADADVWRELCARRFALEPACSRHHPPPPEGWKALFVLHHEALFRLFRGESERDRMRGGVGAGLEGIGKGRLGGVRIRLGA
jgi:hypothetical protein